MPATPPETTYDVFISYSHADQTWVWEWLIPRLKGVGLAVCTDRESFALGVPSLINMENAVAASRHTLLVLTPAYLASEWTMYEQLLAQTQDPIGLRQRTIPVLRQPCTLPMRIAMLTYADLTGKLNEEAELARILRAIGGKVTRPAAPPPVSSPPVTPPAPARPAFDTAAVRELLTTAFSDEDLTTFCYDYFRPVYEEFAGGMSRTGKVQRLVEYCEHQGEMARLLALVKQKNAYQYGRFEWRLRSATPAPDPDPPPDPADLPPNPFSGAVTVGGTTHFIGRQAELRRLRALLTAGSVILIGPPKIGMSSLLRQLAHTWPGKVIGPINWLELVDKADFFAQLAKALELNKDADSWAIRDALRTQEGLLLLDELDAAPARGLTHDDLALFRGVTTSNPRLKLVAVSHRPLKEVFPYTGLGSPAYNTLQPLTIGLLNDADARQLLAHPWAPDAPQFDPPTLAQLLKLAGGHPFKLHRAAFHRYEVLCDPEYDWEAAYRQDLEHLL